MKKKYSLIILGLVLLFLNIGAYHLDKNPYSNYENIDMQNIEVSLTKEGNLECKLKDNIKKKYYLKQKNALEKVVTENMDIKNYIKNELEKGKNIKALSYTECYLENEVNEAGEVSSRILTKDEVKGKKSVYEGKHKKRGRLTLISSLITDEKLVGDKAYALSSIALWDTPLFNALDQTEIKDYISLCWPNTYEYNGVDIAKGNYVGGKEIKFNKEKIVKNSGIIWSFYKREKSTIDPDKITVATQLIPMGEKEEMKIFASEYIHVCKNNYIKLRESTPKRYGGVEINDNSGGWKISSPIRIKTL